MAPISSRTVQYGAPAFITGMLSSGFRTSKPADHPWRVAGSCKNIESSSCKEVLAGGARRITESQPSRRSAGLHPNPRVGGTCRSEKTCSSRSDSVYGFCLKPHSLHETTIGALSRSEAHSETYTRRYTQPIEYGRTGTGCAIARRHDATNL
jgi:hypothetical protein